MQPSGEVGRFEVVDFPSPPADRYRSPVQPPPVSATTSTPSYVASCSGRAVWVAPQHSAQQLTDTAPESLADLCCKLRRRVEASLASNDQRETSSARKAADL
jgi:hypothetical protein